MNDREAEGIHNPPATPRSWNTGSALFRGMRLAGHLAYAMLLAGCFPVLGRPRRRLFLQRWSLELLTILNVRLRVIGAPPGPHEKSMLLVANHISWLDVFVMNAVRPAGFVAKSEVRSWPVIGTLCKAAQTIFIERNVRRDTMRVNRLIAHRLGQGECVALFPEGTSTDGSHVDHFHSSLLQCAVDANVCVRPVAVRYHDGAGLRCGDASYFGEMSFIQSLLNILHSPSLHATLVFLPELASRGKNRRALADDARAAICKALHSLAPGVATGRSPSGAKAQFAPHYPEVSAPSVYSPLLHPLANSLKHPRP